MRPTDSRILDSRPVVRFTGADDALHVEQFTRIPCMPTPPDAPPVPPDPKPTVEQVAWVFRCLLANRETYQSFRGLIYETMGYDQRAYFPLYVAGGQEITNLLLEASEPKA